jgi:hypothetical protein
MKTTLNDPQQEISRFSMIQKAWSAPIPDPGDAFYINFLFLGTMLGLAMSGGKPQGLFLVGASAVILTSAALAGYAVCAKTAQVGKALFEKKQAPPPKPQFYNWILQTLQSESLKKLFRSH